MQTKVCKTCGIEKDINNFHKDKGEKDGFRIYCKQCVSQNQKQYYKENSKNCKENSKEYSESHKKEESKYQKEYRNSHKEKQSSYQNDYKKLFPQKFRKYNLKSKYGITLEQYNKMLQDQNGVCAICGKEEPIKELNKKKRDLSVDHNHKTGKVRGLLCSKCNNAIGLFQDNKNLLIKAIKYLIKE